MEQDVTLSAADQILSVDIAEAMVRNVSGSIQSNASLLMQAQAAKLGSDTLKLIGG